MTNAVLDGLQAEDITEIVAKQVAKAKAGDPAAAKFVIGLVQAQKRAAAPAPPAIQLAPAEPEPPKPVAIDSPGAEQQRRLVAFILLAHQPMSLHGLGQQTGLTGEQVDAVLNHEWFARQNGQARLTTAGKNAVG
jgi:hypothetical protein